MSMPPESPIFPISMLPWSLWSILNFCTDMRIDESMRSMTMTCDDVLQSYMRERVGLTCERRKAWSYNSGIWKAPI